MEYQEHVVDKCSRKKKEHVVVGLMKNNYAQNLCYQCVLIELTKKKQKLVRNLSEISFK